MGPLECTRTREAAMWRYRLRHNATAPSTARRITRTTLIDWGWQGEHIDSALLVVSELVTNAIEHALPPVEVHLHPDPMTLGPPNLRLMVTDGGPNRSHESVIRSGSRDEHGRGTLIVHHLARIASFDTAVDNRWITLTAA